MEKGDTVSIVGEYGEYIVDNINSDGVTIAGPPRYKHGRLLPKQIVGVFPSHKLYKLYKGGSIIEQKEEALNDVLAAMRRYQQTMAHLLNDADL